MTVCTFRWALVDTASWIVRFPPAATNVVEGKNPIVWMMDEAVKAGFNMLRLFGHGAEPPYKLQISPGVYDENMFKGMDYILEEAGKRGIKLIISFSTNWGNVDSKKQFVSWAKDARLEDDFWINESIKQMYKDHLQAVLTRRNTFNGIEYKDDPTIFAWNIFNEVRCYAEFCRTADAAFEWNKEMAKFIKSIDNNHLLTTGQEGFYGWGCPTGEGTHPLDESHATGQDFIRDAGIPEIDFAAIHLWPNNWDIADDPKFPLQWVRQHAEDARKYIKKPLVLEEFGVETENTDDSRRKLRDPVFKSIFDEVSDSISSGGALRGAMFWEWFINDNAPPSIHGVNRGHSTWGIVTEHGRKIAKLNEQAGTVPKCTPGRDSSSVESSKPDNQYKLEGCCDGDCNALYGDLRGETFQESIAAGAGECCRSCKFANIRARKVVCTGWSWCPCGQCDGAKQGTCRLKKSKNPFLPSFWQVGQGQPWVSGIPGDSGKLLSPWKCHPTGVCAYDENCPDFAESIQCVDRGCGAARFDLWSGAEVLVLSTNSMEKPYDAANPPDVTSAAQCCAKCRSTKGCNGWRFCPREEGCAIYRKPCKDFKDVLGLGPHEECAPGGKNFPKFMCTLFNVDTKNLNPVIGDWNVYVSGVIDPRINQKLKLG
ncbi:hypothetical protein BSKO_06583 [Bryopsis sp. KO-2023]|nr:hypothetical protein BSKO_06583 [Bryopsis sp. KO-2023]